MLVEEGQLLKTTQDYLQLDGGSVCIALESVDTDTEFAIMAITPEGRMLVPVEYIELLEVHHESTK